MNILSPVLSVSSRYLHASPYFVCYIIIVIIIRRVTVRVSTERRLRVCRKCSSQPSAFFYLFFSRSKRKTPANYYTPPRCLGPSLVIPPSYIKKNKNKKRINENVPHQTTYFIVTDLFECGEMSNATILQKYSSAEKIFLPASKRFRAWGFFFPRIYNLKNNTTV